MKTISIIVASLLLSASQGINLNKKCPTGKCQNDDRAEALDNVVKMTSDMKNSADKK